MTHPIIGLMGRKRHGKDSVAAVLVEKYGFRRFAFADALREAALALDPIISGWTEDYPGATEYRLSAAVDTLGWEKAKEIDEVRRTLQRFGTGIRDINPDFWVDAVVRPLTKHDGPTVITDVRFPNEYAAILDLGGTLVRVYRPGLPDDDTHVSETALDNYAPDYVIDNSGTLEELATQVEYLATPQRWATGL